jgi:hypothetical protein
MRIWIVLLCFALELYAESVAGLRWTAPAGWKNEGSRPMRAATYGIAPVAGDKDNAECVVYFFGAGQGGGVEANIDRWKGQFRQPADAKVRKRTVHALPITTVDISGEYSGMGGPMTVEKTSKSGYRLLGAIVEGPGGNVFLKLTGPAKTIAANEQQFEQLLASFDKGSK